MRVSDSWVDFVFNAILLEGYEYPYYQTREILETGEVKSYTGSLKALWLLYAAHEALLLMEDPNCTVEQISETILFTGTTVSEEWSKRWVENFQRRQRQEPILIYKEGGAEPWKWAD